MAYKGHGDRARNFDGQAFKAALTAGDTLTAHRIVVSGSRHEKNRRSACDSIAQEVLRRLGYFPMRIEDVPPTLMLRDRVMMKTTDKLYKSPLM